MKIVQNNIPQLRFSEFSNNWQKKRLDEVSEINRGKSKHRPRNAKFLYGGKYPFVQTGDIRGASLYLDSYTQTYSEKGLAQSKLWDEGTLCITIAANIAETTILKIKACFPDSIIGLIPYKEKTIVLFLKYQFDKFKIDIQKLSEGIAQSNLNKEKLSKIEFLFPKLPEQQKIASFLTAVDTKIAKLTNKKELLEKYKKGVMQQIFNQEIRFKDDDGNFYPNWKVKLLGDIGSFQTSSVDKLSKDNQEEIHLVNYMNVYRHEEINNKTIEELQVVTAKENQIKSSNLLKGDILFTPSSETPTDIGHSVVIFEDINNAVYSYHLMRFRPKIEIDILYSHYFCNTTNVLKQLSRFATGSTRFTISVGNFSKVKVKLPCIEEQTKIANFLSSIDAKIDQVAYQLEKTKIFKKGLLQQLFV